MNSRAAATCRRGGSKRWWGGAAACLLAAASLGGPGCGSVDGADAATLAAARATITSSELQQHVDILADDTFEGREAGSRGGRAAAGYLVEQLRRLGIRGGGEDGSYFQEVRGRYRNVLAWIEGRDPELRSQVVVVGAHYDHVGYGTRSNSYGPTGSIHNGADDNASGVAGLLELAEALQQLPEPPRRSLLLAFWDAEEKGLIGSEYWTNHPTVPLDQLAAAVNVDMIGQLRKNRVEVYGIRTGRGLRQLISRQNDAPDLWLDFQWSIEANSDHYSFLSKGIPIVMLHTGLHDKYHRPSDDAHTVQAAGMQRVSQLLFGVVHALAEADEPPAYRSRWMSESFLTQQRIEQPRAPIPSRLGITWSRDADIAEGLLVKKVAADSPAEAAGIQEGDRLTVFRNKPVDDLRRFPLEVLAAPAEVSLQVKRGGEVLDLQATLRGQPVRLGLSWRIDPAEPASVLVTNVRSGSAAHQGGVQLGDRILEVNGRGYADSDELLQRTATLPGPLELLVERRGHLRRLELDVLPADKIGAAP